MKLLATEKANVSNRTCGDTSPYPLSRHSLAPFYAIAIGAASLTRIPMINMGCLCAPYRRSLFKPHLS